MKYMINKGSLGKSWNVRNGDNNSTHQEHLSKASTTIHNHNNMSLQRILQNELWHKLS